VLYGEFVCTPSPWLVSDPLFLSIIMGNLMLNHIILIFNVQVCTEMGVDAPISVSMKLGDIGNLFRRIVDAAQRPHLSIPETEQGRTRKHRKRLIQRSLTVAAGKLRINCSLTTGIGVESELASHSICSAVAKSSLICNSFIFGSS